jgi:1,4-dihydroxy-2-naphthoyl-CoA hydrolase
MWFIRPTLEEINGMSRGTMAEHLGIVFTAIGDDYIEAQMPVDKRTYQPMGLLHGGASVALAETLGSFGAYLCVDATQKACVGLEINANHIRSVRQGVVTGRARARHIGQTTHVWEITVTNEEEKIVCLSRLTVQILNRA